MPSMLVMPSVVSFGAGAVEPSSRRCTPVTAPSGSTIQLFRTPAFLYTYNPAGGCARGALKSHFLSPIDSVPTIALPCRRPSSRLVLSLLARLTAPFTALPRNHDSTVLPSQA